MRQRFGVLAVVGLAGLLVGGAGGALAGRTVLSPAKAVSATQQKASSSELNQTIALIRSNYYASNLDYSKLDRGSANGVVQALGDPYSYYLDPAQARAAEGSQASQQGEVGLYLSSSDCPARPLVSGVAPGSPAEQQGLTQGDVVISIDGVDTDHLSVEQAANRIRGQTGTTVVLDVQRAGRSFNVALTRTSGAPPSVRMASLGDGVLYLRINQFDPSTTTAFHAELQAGLGGAHAIVLDLRNNPGGLVGTADSVISEFVPSGVAFALQSRSRDVPEPLEIIGGVCAHGGRCNLLISVGTKRPIPCSGKGSREFFKRISAGAIAMHFCLTGQYTPRALNSILENPTQNRAEAVRKVVEAAGGKLISFYGTPVEGPGVLTIFDVPDPAAAPAILGIAVAAGTLQNVKLTRLLTQDEIMQVRQQAIKLRGSYSPPGS